MKPCLIAILQILLKRCVGIRARRIPRERRHQTLLLDAAVAIRAGRFDEASRLLGSCTALAVSDPVYLNLHGVLCIARQKWNIASRCFGMAVSLDPHYAPAQQNLLRLYELDTFGKSKVPLVLGDAEIRRNRDVPCGSLQSVDEPVLVHGDLR